MPHSALSRALLLSFPAKIKSFYATQNNSQNYVISKWMDFICLGGIGILIIPIILSFSNYGDTNFFRSEVSLATFYLSFFINYPHFIHSYQLFFASYKNLPSDNLILRRRFQRTLYLMPIIFFTIASLGLVTTQELYFKLLISLMFFLVGWHYVKQAYGVLIISCNLNKVRFSRYEKRVLLIICHAIWLAAWGLNNAGASAPDSFGVTAFNVKLPDGILFLLMLIAISASFEFIRLLLSRFLSNKPLPNFVALSSFFVSIYIWMFFSNIAFYFLLIPALHSLQYLTITYRAQTQQYQGSWRNKNFRHFVMIGIISGIMFFIAIPTGLNNMFGEQYSKISPEIFSLVIIVFINIHHYFIDSVIWKKDNEYLMKNLR